MPTNPKILDLKKHSSEVKRALELAEELQSIGSKLGFNAFQPGAMKELKMAKLLGHDWILSKKDADACSINNNGIDLYEYLSGKEGGAGQIDRVFKGDAKDAEQQQKHENSMKRIRRNKAFYLAYTNPDTTLPLDILRIYEVSTEAIKEETEKQLSNSKNTISHVAFHEDFAREKGTLVWEK